MKPHPLNLTLAGDNVTSTIQVTLARDNVIVRTSHISNDNVRGVGCAYFDSNFANFCIDNPPLVFLGPL